MKRLLAVLILLSASAFAQTTCINCPGSAYGATGGTVAGAIPEATGTNGQLQDSSLIDVNVGFQVVEGVAPSGVASSDVFYADSTLHAWAMKNNNGSALQVVGVASPTNNVLCKFSSGNCTNSLATDSGTTFTYTGTGGFLGPDGTAAAVAFGQSGHAGSGMFFSSSGVTQLSVLGTSRLGLTTAAASLPSAFVFGFAAAADLTVSPTTALSKVTAGVVGVGTGAAAATDGTIDLATVHYRGLAQTYFVASDFTTSGVGTALETITGLSWTFPASIAINARVDCYLLYNQNAGTAAVAFGFKDTSIAPTNLAASGIQHTNTTVATEGTLAASATTTATNIVSATPSAITTIWPVQLHLLIEQPSNASSSLFAIQTSTATAGDTVTVKRGSYCTLTQ